MKLDVVKHAGSFEVFLDKFTKRMLGLNAERKRREQNAFWQVFYVWRENCSEVVDFLSLVDSRYSGLKDVQGRLGAGAQMVFGREDTFLEIINELKGRYRKYSSDLIDKLSTLHDDEKMRLNEAYHTLREECYWSAIANCAVLLESRLLKILKRRNTQFLKTKNKNLRFTFGKLVDIYLDDKHKFKNCIPQKHEDVLKLLNKYRVFSVHAKQVVIDKNEADALFILTLRFIFDPKCIVAKRKSVKTN